MNHHLVGESSPPPFYTIREVVEFEVVIKEKVNGEWVPFNGKDVQVKNTKTSVFPFNFMLLT